MRNVATLASGQGLVTLVPILAAPILSRLYMPTDYGLLAAYMAVSGLFAVVSVWQMHQSIISEPSERDAVSILSLCTLIGFIMAIVASIAAFFVWISTISDPLWQPVHPWLLLLPVSVFGTGMTAGIAALANRRSRYAFMAKVQIAAILASVGLSITLGFAGWGASGLFCAYFMQQGVTIAAHLALLTRLEDIHIEKRWKRLRVLFRRHRKFAFFTLPSEFLGTFNQNLPVYALSALGATASLGAFNRARTLVALPFNLLGSAITMVFRQRAAEHYRKTGNCRTLYVQTGLALFALGLIPITILVLFAPDLFRIVLGPNWTEAGEFARILAPMLLFRLVCSPLSSIFMIAGRQRADFILSVISMLVLTSSLYIGMFGDNSPATIVLIYSIAFAAIYFTYTIIGFRYSVSGNGPAGSK